MPILVMLHTGSTFLFSVMVCVISLGLCGGCPGRGNFEMLYPYGGGGGGAW